MNREEQQRFHGLFDTVAELNRMREFWRAGVDSGSQGQAHSSAWIPRIDIFADGDDLVMRCELAGVARDEVDISLENNVLTIFGERTGAPAVEDNAYYVRERQYGSFRRTINLPDGIERSRVTAALEDGLLEITVAGGCKARRKPERIDISVSGDGRDDRRG